MSKPAYSDHHQLRQRWQQIINTYGWTCRRCGQPIPPHQPKAWHLGHQTDATPGGPKPKEPGREPEHSHCNTSAGATAGNHTRTGQPPPSRQW